MIDIVFLGTPDFAVSSLKALVENGYNVKAVFTQPDRPKGRGNKLAFSPVKEYAISKNIPVFQPTKIRLEENAKILKDLNCELMVTAAFGQILSKENLESARLGCVNVHASLLPAYRGSSPIQWAVINGEKETGVTIMQTAYKMDSGDIILQKSIPVGEDETAGELFEKLSALGAPALIEALDLIESGKATFTPQNEDEMTYFPMLKKEDGEIDFSMSATDIKHRIQGLTPWPSAYTTCGGKKMKIIKATVENMQGSPKQVLKADKDGLIVACGKDALNIQILQPENGRKMSAKDYLLGHRIAVGEEL